MSAPYTPQQQIQKGKVSLLPFSSPAALDWNGQLVVFYNGAGNDGFWFANTAWQQPDKWVGPTSLRLSGAKSLVPFPGATPSPIIFQNELYVWYTHINGQIYGTRNERGTNKWTDVFPVWGAITGEKLPIAPPTSPQTVEYKGLLYFFWVVAPGYEAVNRMQYATYDGKGNWSKAQWVSSANLGIKPGTSACVNVFKDTLNVFYDGSGDDGTWLASFKDGQWAPVQSMAKALGWFGMIDFTDPDSWSSTDGKTQTISNGSAIGSWVTTTQDNVTWSPVINIARAIGAQGMAPGTSARGTSFQNRTYIFWNGIGEAGLWFTRETTTPKILDKVESTVVDSDTVILPTPDMVLAAAEQSRIVPYSDIDEKGALKMAFDLPAIETATTNKDRVRVKGLLPTVREVERYGWVGAMLRKFLGFAGKTLLVFIALVLMTLGWHYVSLSCAHEH